MTKEQFDKLSIEQPNTVVIVDVYAPWCGPCKGIMPILEQISEEFKEDVVLSKVNIEDDDYFSETYSIKSVPTVLIFKGGELQQKIVGPKTKDAYIEFVKELL
jgi:thioredoxin 1